MGCEEGDADKLDERHEKRHDIAFWGDDIRSVDKDQQAQRVLLEIFYVARNYITGLHCE
jgi:hypothetical protein